MINEVFKVKFISVKDCFLHFSFAVLRKLTSNYVSSSAVKLVQDNVNCELYFTWAPQPFGGLDDDCLGVSAIYAGHLGLTDDATVILSMCNEVPLVRTVCVTAATHDDYEVMEMSQNELQSSMLDQVRVVSVGQPVTIWFSKTLHCSINVDSMDLSSKIGRLEQLTDIVVSPSIMDAALCGPVENREACTDVNNIDELNNRLKMCNFTNSLDLEGDSGSKLNEILRKENCSGIFRVTILNDSASSCCDNLHNGIKHPYNAFTNKKVLSVWVNKVIEENSAVVCFLRLLPHKFNKELLKKEADSEICVRLYSIHDNCQKIPLVNTESNCSSKTIYLSNTVKNVMHLRTGCKVKLRIFTPCLDTKLLHVELTFNKNLSTKEVESWFREDLSNNSNTLMNNNAPMPIESCAGVVECVTVTLWPSTIPCWPFSSAELKTCELSLNYEEEKDSDKSENESEHGKQESDDSEECVDNVKQNILSSFSSISNLSRALGDVLKEGLVSFELCLRLSGSSCVLSNCSTVQMNNNVMCVGSGAYILCGWLCNWLSGPPHNVYISKIDCKSLKGKKGENIQKRLTDKLQKCIYYQPSLLVLLDVDAIAGVPAQPENSAEEIFLLGMGRMIRDTLLEFQSNQSFGILASARSTAKVSSEIVGPRGYHLFPTLLQIPALSKDDRIVIIKEIINKKLKLNHISSNNLDEFATKTEGYSYEDLLLLADKAFFQAWQRKAEDKSSEELYVTVGDLLFALDSYTPSHLHSINLYKSIDHSWSSVGGMQVLKETLTEVIIWPSKFRNVYEQCPLSSESGVLLYGVPGTGKTLLASALAGEAGLNFISIKGPELLSKYIGASEEAVRKVFEKAKKAKPCILFFDEFDSLAPRRGHDSSGVMDRVVNQLLTQMDGVEERTGVYIIAATSRPDLLDPALLRPGRIGHTLHCPLPDTNDRLEIIKVLSKRLILEDDCNLSFLANQTEGFSGADLQAAIYGAQMLAYDDMVNEDNISVKPEADDFTVQMKPDISNKLVVKHSHLVAALKDTNPSLKLEELRRYQRIYENFQRMRSKTYNGESLPIDYAQKVTLA